MFTSPSPSNSAFLQAQQHANNIQPQQPYFFNPFMQFQSHQQLPFGDPIMSSQGSYSAMFHPHSSPYSTSISNKKRCFNDILCGSDHVQQKRHQPDGTQSAPMNCERNLILGFIGINNCGRKVYSCFIGNCRFKSYTTDMFDKHLDFFHDSRLDVLRGFCMGCEKFEHGNTFFGEFMQLYGGAESENLVETDKIEMPKIKEEEEEVEEIVDDLNKTIVSNDDMEEEGIVTENDQELTEIVSGKLPQISSVQSLNGMTLQREERTPVKNLQNFDKNQQEFQNNSKNSAEIVPNSIQNQHASYFGQQIPTSSAKTATKVSTNEPKSDVKLEPIDMDETIKIHYDSEEDSEDEAVPEKTKAIAAKKRSETDENGLKVLSQKRSVSVEKRLNFKENRSVPVEKQSIPSEKLPISTVQQQIPKDSLSTPKRRKRQSYSAQKSLPQDSPSDLSTSSDSSFKQPKTVKRTCRKRTMSTFASSRNISNKKQQRQESEELNDTACLKFISKKIAASKGSTNSKKVEPNESVKEPKTLSNTTIENLLESIMKRTKSEAEDATTSNKSESTKSIQLEPKKTVDLIQLHPKYQDVSAKNGFDLSQHTAYTVDVAELTKKSLSSLEFVSVKELYPWIDGSITGAIFKTKAAIDAHLKELSLFSTFKCMNALCCFFTIDLEEFKKHVKCHDSINNYCCYCLKTFERCDELCSHLDVVHKFDRFQCSKCMYRSCQKGYVDIHQKNHHTEELLDCQVLKSPVQKLMKSDRMKCMQILQKNREKFVFPYRCKTPRCREIFYNKDNFLKHLEFESLNPTCRDFIPLICQQLLTIDHSKTSNRTEGVYQCLHCQYGTDNADIITHMAENHPHEFAYICKRVKPQKLVELNILSGRETVGNATSIEYIGSTATEAKNYEGDLEKLNSTKFEKEVTKKQLIVTDVFTVDD